MATEIQPSEPADGEPDAAVVERFLAGDSRAFDEIVARHQRAVYLAARRLLGSHADADEAAQRTFVRAWRSLRGFRGEASLRTWLMRIMLNVTRTLRAERVSGEGPLADATEAVAPGRRPDERIGSGQLGGLLRAAVATLPPRQREVVALKVFSDMTHREVAGLLGLSEGAVKAHLHQAVANLRRRLARHAGGRV